MAGFFFVNLDERFRHQARKFVGGFDSSLLKIDDYFAVGSFLYERVGGGDVVCGEVLVVEEGRQLPQLHECSGLREDFAVVGAADSCEEGQEGEDSGVGGSAEGERG